MPLKLNELPESERPYEKLKMYGEKNLSNAELLAIIIKSGTKEETAVDLARRILLLVDNISELQNISLDSLEKIKGIGKVKAIQIKAVCELATRINKPVNKIKKRLNSSSEVAKLFINEFKNEKQEKLILIMLNIKNEIIKIHEIKSGTVNKIIITPSEIMKEIIKEQIPKFILLHNHPSGDPTPSKADIEFTKKIEKVAQILEVAFIDHIIIGAGTYKSIFLERNDEKCNLNL